MFNKKKKTFNNHSNFFLKGNSYSTKKCLIFIIVVFILILFLNLTSFSRKIRGAFYSVSKPAQRWLWQKGLFASNFFEGIIKSSRLKNENAWLLEQNRKLMSKNIELEELKEENSTLRKALNLGLEKDFDLEIAEIIGKDSDHFITINKGAEDGLESNLLLITGGKVLIGEIVEVYESISKVRLLTSKESLVNVEVFQKDINGLLKGNNNSNYSLDLIPKEADISSGDLVITSNLGSDFPKNLIIGKIIDIQETDQSSFKKATIEPSRDVEDLENVFIILNSSF